MNKNNKFENLLINLIRNEFANLITSDEFVNFISKIIELKIKKYKLNNKISVKKDNLIENNLNNLENKLNNINSNLKFENSNINIAEKYKQIIEQYKNEYENENNSKDNNYNNVDKGEDKNFESLEFNNNQYSFLKDYSKLMKKIDEIKKEGVYE